MDLTRLTPRMASLLPTSLLCLRWSAAREKRQRQSKLLKVAGRRQRIGCIFEGFTFAKPEDALKLRVTLQTFEEYCAPRKNLIIAVLKFNERPQGESESFEFFVTDLKIRVKDCGL